jgi:MFS transporter, SP family, general alpha glucoside:H+ symporter
VPSPSLADPTHTSCHNGAPQGLVAFVESEHRDNVLRMTDITMRKMSVANPEILAITLEAKQGTGREKSMTLRQSFPVCKNAMAWSILFSTAIVMEGSDSALLGSFYALSKFSEKYGELIGNDATPP